MNDNTDPVVMTIVELCARWKCSPKTVYEAIDEKRLHVFRIGKRAFRVTLAEVIRYEQARDAA